MTLTRETLHDLVDVVDTSEIDLIFRFLVKFIPEDETMPDEVEALKTAAEEIARGEVFSDSEIDWD